MLDFKTIKQRVSIEDALSRMAVITKREGNQLRASCPTCSTEGGNRDLVVTPERSIWYCFKAKKGGDVLNLVQHLRGGTLREAAVFLSTPEENEKTADREKGGAFDPEKYILSIDRKHPLVEQLGFTEADCERYGMGVAHKGVNAGRFCIPLRDRDGKIIVFLSVTELKLPKRWRDG